MDNDSGFAELVEKARSGDLDDLQAAVSKFEPHLARAVQRRRRRQSAKTRGFYETKDCLQSVLTVFYRKVADQSHELNITSFGSLRRLLLKMVRDKLVDYERRSYAGKRPATSDAMDEFVDKDGATPSAIVARNEELSSISDGLSDAERRILELTRDGHSSEEIAEMVGGRSGRSVRRFLSQLKDGFKR